MTTPTRKQEDEAAKVVEKAINVALDKMSRIIERRLLAGKDIDATWLTGTVTMLEDLADEYRVKIGKGKFGDILEQAGYEGNKDAHEALGAKFESIDKATLDRILFKADREIKDILDDGIKRVNVVITNAIISGRSLRQIAGDVRASLTLGEESYQVPKWRADMIARNELHSAYRNASRERAEKIGAKFFKMLGPVDMRTAAICLEHVGKTKTAAEWESISPVVFSYGLHHNCRHSWVPSFDPEKRDDYDIKQVKRVKAEHRKARQKKTQGVAS
jgi:hypothetical protein